MRRADPIIAIKREQKRRGLIQSDLRLYMGVAANRVSEVMNKRRALTLPMIRRLHANLGISADVLIQPYKLNR